MITTTITKLNFRFLKVLLKLKMEQDIARYLNLASRHGVKDGHLKDVIADYFMDLKVRWRSNVSCTFIQLAVSY